ncbi:putative pectinesterase/pectinesterase inhibitor 12 [Nymphaea thermarum]|nr:putative pectinesterase/pectinesterase inhibitor 12 [Nymphaea thermarum]
MAGKRSCRVAFLLASTLLLLSTLINPCCCSSSSSFNDYNTTAITSFCNSTPYPPRCVEISKLLSIGIPNIGLNLPFLNLPPAIRSLGHHTLQQALSEASKLTSTIVALGSAGIVEKLRGTIEDCKELHYVTLDLLQSCINDTSGSAGQNAVAFLSAALTNKQTCLEGLESASGLFKPLFIASLNSVYELVHNALAIFVKGSAPAAEDKGAAREGRRTEEQFPSWLDKKDRRLLQSSGSDGGDGNDTVLVVAQDGSGDFTTISDAIQAVPDKSLTRVVVYVKEGVYDENVEIPRRKQYVALLGDGADRTIVTGNRSVGDGWTTFRSATVAVVGEGFLARDITFRNTAGPSKGQAVALRVGSDLSAVYRCYVEGYQDSLYAHSLRQFYRDSVIAGTVDFIFGNAAAVFQASQVVARNPLHGQSNTVTAQGRFDPDQKTGFSFQGCTLLPDQDLAANLGKVKTYLGRPWRLYSTTVFMESYLEQHIDPSGWSPWSGNPRPSFPSPSHVGMPDFLTYPFFFFDIHIRLKPSAFPMPPVPRAALVSESSYLVCYITGDTGLATLYYGEYANTGPSSDTSNRVTWPGFHIMSYEEATNFTVPSLILGDQWLDSTSVPYNASL